MEILIVIKDGFRDKEGKSFDVSATFKSGKDVINFVNQNMFNRNKISKVLENKPCFDLLKSLELSDSNISKKVRNKEEKEAVNNIISS